MYKSIHSEEWGLWAHCCRSQAGNYPQFSRKQRRELEIKAHKAGIQQIPRLWSRYLLKKPNGFFLLHEVYKEAAE